MAISTGQITIIDFNDALTLTSFISSNHPKSQIYNPDNGTYIPNWASTNLVLTPSLFKLGTATDIISSAEVTKVEWLTVESGVEKALVADANHVLSGAKNHILTIKTNDLASVNAKDWVVKITYLDPSTGLSLVVKSAVTFSKVVNGSGIADAVIQAINGNIFKNGTVASLKLKAELWRGSVVDATLVTYQWYQMDAAVTTDQGGGIGWRKLTDVANVVTGTATDTLTVFPAAVSNYSVFKVLIKDTDTGSNTYNTTFVDTVSVVDQSDPIQVNVVSTGGDVFKNGAGSTSLTAKLYRAGTEIDAAGTKYTYKWYKYNKDSVLDANFGGTGVNFKTGKTLAVGDADVDVKATFVVEVE